jgi:hypothetical protein
MKCHSARGASLAILLAALSSTAWCQDARPNLFPLPPLPPIGNGYAVVPAAANDALWGQAEISPLQTAPLQSPKEQIGPLQAPPIPQVPQVQKDHTVLSPDYVDAMKGSYDSCTSGVGSPCGGACCGHGCYVFANALVMSALKPGGFVTSVDEFDGYQRLNFCNQEFGKLWAGGFEIGAGWCLGGGCGCCNNTAIEMVYWGVFPSTQTIRARENVTSTIDFGDLDYDGLNANFFFTDSRTQQVAWGYNFNSVEVNLVGNSWCGGPFGCGMCGGCCGNGGSPWGFGYIAGFRYINFSDQFLFSSDPSGNYINGDPEELNYAVACTNNLYGFQLGAGLSYCVTDRFTAYCISKYGVYGNSVTALQKVYGGFGTATILNGPNTNEDFDVRTAPRATLGLAGQFDLGGRWSVTDNWSVNFGYRVLGLAGVATTDVNIRNNNFHDVDGIAAVQRNGSFLLHGAFAGATFCW